MERRKKENEENPSFSQRALGVVKRYREKDRSLRRKKKELITKRNRRKKQKKHAME